MEKIRLAMKDDVEVTSKKSLRENWDLERIVSYYRDGSLHRFLTERWCKGEAAKVEQLENITDTRELQRKLCEIFDMPFVEEEAVDVEEQERREKRLEALRAITSDNEVLANVDKVAFDQEELADLLDKDESVIYLVNNEFSVPLEAENKKYIGVGKAVAEIYSDVPVDFNALGIEFKNVTFDEKYAGIAKAAEPKLEMAQSEQPVSDIVTRMKQVTEKCWNEYKNDLDGEMFFYLKDVDSKRKIEEIVAQFAVKTPEAPINNDEIVALFIPKTKTLHCLLVCKTGFYFVKDNYMYLFGMKPKLQSRDFKYINWSNFIYAYYTTKNEFYNDPLLNAGMDTDGIVLKYFDGKTTELATDVNNAYLQNFVITWINQLNEVNEVDNSVEPSEATKSMITTIEELKKTADNSLDGKIYVNGNIPKEKLGNAISLFTKMIPDKMIKRSEIVALYLSHFKYYAQGHRGIGCSLNCILFTEQGFYLSKNPSGKREERNEITANFVSWSEFDGAWYTDKPGKYRYPHYLEIRGNKNGSYYTIMIGTQEKPDNHEKFCENFLIPLLYRFSGKNNPNNGSSVNNSNTTLEPSNGSFFGSLL